MTKRNKRREPVNLSIWNSLHRELRHLAAEPHLLISIGLSGIVLLLAIQQKLQIDKVVMLTWTVGILSFLIQTWTLMFKATPAYTKAHADLNETSPIRVLGLASLTAIISLICIGLMLANGRDRLETALACTAIIATWLWIHTIFALHYASYYYDTDNISEERLASVGYAGGLDFPTMEDDPDFLPDYLDFLYFSFTVSWTAQTSDVSVNSRIIRRMLLAHGLISFLFYAVILGLVITTVGNFIQ